VCRESRESILSGDLDFFYLLGMNNHLGMDETLQTNGLKHYPQLVQAFHWNFG